MVSGLLFLLIPIGEKNMRTSLKFYLFRPGNMRRLFVDLKHGDLALADLEDYKTITESRDIENYYKKLSPREKPVKFNLTIELKKIK